MSGRDRLVRFAEFAFDPDTGEIAANGASVRLQEQPSRVLEVLTGRAGHLVTRHELQALLWPENSLVDADNGLNIAINKIRLALDDSATRPRFVQTVPRRGYRFIGEIVPNVAVQAAAPIASAPPPRPTRARVIGLGIASALALSGAVVVLRHQPTRTAAIRSIAVMPFSNLAGDRLLNDAVEGLTDTIATGLAAYGLPHVISTEVTAKFRNSSASPAQIARELRADTIVLGTVVRDGAAYSINVRLIDAPSEEHVWAKRFRRATATELTFAEDIPAGIAAAVGMPRQATALSAGSVQVPKALRDEYLHRRYWNLATPQEEGAAIEHLTRTIEGDRANALSWAALADVYASGAEAPSRLFTPWPGAVAAGVRAAQQAIQLDPSFAEPHVALGQLRLIELRWSDAEWELAEAVRLSPDYAIARQWYALVLLRLQKCSTAIAQAAAGIGIDPTDPISTVEAGSAFAACGQPERAVAAFSQVLAAHPDYPMTHLQLGGAYLRLGNAAASLAELRTADRLRPDQCEIPARMANVLEQLGRHGEARLQAARVDTYQRFESSIQYCTALADAATGDLDGAFAALNAAIAAHEERILFLLTDFQLGRLRSDPRWVGVVERAGLAPYLQPTVQAAPMFLLLKRPS